MFLNLSNHPSANWSAEQTEAATRLYGEVIDLPFPAVNPAGDEAYIADLADEYCQKVLALAEGKNITVHLMGEMTLTFAILKRLQAYGIPCVASTTRRETMEENGVKTSVFKFVKFRNYNVI
ncbi:MAG: CRISPR-associated protein [Bacteroidales bacterium]|nr:CRISPR-associated protein [Bacteroidales bacterium]